MAPSTTGLDNATKPLHGRVAVVAGATRGAGRGIARGLGEAGATVYCTGRSQRGNPSPYGRPETIEETAELVTGAGGVGIAVRVDHTVEAEVKALFGRVKREQGRLDVLANSVAGEDPLLAGWTSFWKTDLAHGDAALRQAILSHAITAKYAAPLMIEQQRGLIVEVTDGDMLFSGGNMLAQLTKFTLKGLAMMMSEELRKDGVTALAITPGFLRSESMLEHFKVTEENWRDGGKTDQNFLESESPLFLGRAVAALAADDTVFSRTASLTSSWEVGAAYGLTDYDGRRPNWGEHLENSVVQSTVWLREGIERHVTWLDQILHHAQSYLGQAQVS